jgi:hypothetical protein
MLQQCFLFGLNRKTIGPEEFRFLDQEGCKGTDIDYES